MRRFPPKVAEQLEFYVYLYLDPRDGVPFYVGKGRGNRCFSHLREGLETGPAQIVRELEKLGLKPEIELLKYGLSEVEALLVEATAIDLLGLPALSNKVRGHGSRVGARAGIDEIIARLGAREVTITENAVLININREYRHGMPPQELYDATRSAWKVGARADSAEFAFSVYRGVVREVYRIEAWHECGTTFNSRFEDGKAPPRAGRWEFVGRIADDRFRRKYLHMSVAHYFKPGAQNPIQYVNCERHEPEGHS